jgi:hypothetical protein
LLPIYLFGTGVVGVDEVLEDPNTFLNHDY